MSQPFFFGNSTDARDSRVAVLRRRLAESSQSLTPDAWRVLGAGLLVILVVAGLVLRQWSSGNDAGVAPEAVLPRVAAAGGGSAWSSGSGPQAPGSLFVYVAGAVARPGVVELPSGSRVGQAIAQVGGTAPDADLERLNLAAKVIDGQRVYVLRKGQANVPGDSTGDTSSGATGGGSANGGGSSQVSLNSATAAQLDSLPGVGPSTAAAILEYRTQHGSFRSIEELGEVKGIGPAKLASLRSRVTL